MSNPSFLAVTPPADHVRNEVEAGEFPADLAAILPPDLIEAAGREIVTWPDYRPTPLIALEPVAGALGLGAVFYKDESARFGLASFKALGGAYAVLRHLADLVSARTGAPVPLADIRSGAHADAVAGYTVATATDGNHGRSVAWGARMAGCRCRIYIHAEVSEGRAAAMRAFGAEVVRIQGNYDQSVRICARDAADHGWSVISDTSYPGYTEIPRYVMAGYGLMATEILDRLGHEPPTHVLVQAGVGGLAAALCARMWARLGPARPRFVIVESEHSACLLASARAGRPTEVPVETETVMAGLSCGEVSEIAWPILARGAADFLAIGDRDVPATMARFAEGAVAGQPVEAGECAAAGLIALIGAARDPRLRAALDLNAQSRVVLIGSEGASDPEVYRSLLDAGRHAP